MSVTPEGPAGSSAKAPGGLDLASRIERAESIGRPAPRISRRSVLIALAVFLVLGVAGGLIDNYLNAHTVNPVAPTTPTSAFPVQAVPASRLHAGMASLMGLSPVHGAAPPFSLTNQTGAPRSLASLRGKVVVLTFFDPSCNDICPVLAKELRDADRDLGSLASSVAFLTVNADPLATGNAAAAEAARRSGLGGPSALPNWQYLTGPLPRLNKVWTAYGISVDVQTQTHQVAHNDLLWLIDPAGQLAYKATPFANEARANASYTLPASVEARWGAGIAHYARHLLAHAPPR